MAAVPVMMGVGAGFSALSSILGGNAQAQAADSNAAMERQNAVVAQQQAALEEDRQRRESAQEIGGMRANYGASGISSTSGSALDVLRDSASQAERDAQTIRWGGKVKALGYNNEAAADERAASAARMNGYLGAAGSLLSGGAKMYGMKRT